MEISPKTFWNYFEIKAATNKVDMATKPSFGKSKGGLTKCNFATNIRKRLKIIETNFQTRDLSSQRNQ